MSNAEKQPVGACPSGSQTDVRQDESNLEDCAPASPDRRKFLGEVVGGLATAWVASGLMAAPLVVAARREAAADELDPLNAAKRRKAAYQVRRKAALFQKKLPLPPHPDNGDDLLYPNRIGSYSKALPHNALGEVIPGADNAMRNALSTGKPADYEAIPLGGTMKLANPQAALAFQLEGADSHHLALPPPPALASIEEGGEAAEFYWQALTRDVPFSDYATDGLIAKTVVDLNLFPNFAGITADTVFRGETPGDRVGPYISQFLWKPIPFGATTVEQKYRTTVSGDNYMTDYASWLAIQNGQPPTSGNVFDPTPRYIRNGRDLGEWVHRDFSYQSFLGAALILLGLGGAAQDAANPYRTSATQGGFITFGGPYIIDLVGRVANEALKAAWYQKWQVHRRLRPEAFGGLVHNHLTGAAVYPLDDTFLGSPALDEVFNRYGTYLLPMAYPEGSPTHPAYPAGHATIAGACATVLKAFFKEDFVIPDPVEASADGLALAAYTGHSLTLGDELNKLASNIAIARDTAGVHWRTDGTDGLKLGEEVAIRILTDLRATYNEDFAGFTLTKFDGTVVTI